MVESITIYEQSTQLRNIERMTESINNTISRLDQSVGVA